MKSLFFAVVFGLCANADAISPKIVKGTWVGTRTEIFGGKSVTGTQSLILKPRRDGGFSGHTTMIFPGIGTIIGSGIYYGDGVYESTSFFRGQVIATASGEWTERGTTIRVKAYAQDLTGFSKATAMLRFVGKRTLVTVTSQSNGGRVSITLHKK